MTMKQIVLFMELFLMGWLVVPCSRATNQEEMSQRLVEATEILEKKQSSSKPIPQKVIDQAKGVVVIEITKGGLGVSGSHGEGILIARTKKGWSAPVAFTQGGGSVGFQIGLEIKQYIYILNTEGALKAFIEEDNFVFDAKAHATAGPEHASEEVSGLPTHSMYIYTASEGAYAGAAIGGQVVSIDRDVNEETYGEAVTNTEMLSGRVSPPEKASKFYETLKETTKKKNL